MVIGKTQDGEPVTSLPLTTILRILKKRYLIEDEDKVGLIIYKFLQKNAENRFFKFSTVKFSLVSELFDHEKKLIYQRGFKIPRQFSTGNADENSFQNDLPYPRRIRTQKFG